ncbi:ornithine cyclodeaminase family protein [Aurantimonas sp. 22II-16-19i]|uniref:ornithine cyclodeaminase family protein n=1 Tax=Aurantimonas sp. 22II-16-19i TaxID=1317114 RepID=UPI0009F7CA63|nr:ornithine cyclodeaminase family protein [Aurantimonas sp. 22II-16-19i]ORE98582.1 ornithine cyclodeaminase/mu-crystallin [Aurantimonas sp. 22II-16-19i]
MITLRILSRTEALAAGAGDWSLAVEDVRETTRLLRLGEAAMVDECVLPVGTDPREKAYGLPASVGGRYDAAGLKWAMHRAAPSAELPSITSTTLVNRLSDGRPLGLVESALLTRMRTAAVSAIAMRMLAAERIRSVAILGAGAQAKTHAEMVRALFPGVSAIRLWNRTPERRDALLAELRQADGPPVAAAATLLEAITDADVVLCCTAAPTPLLGREAVRSGRLVVQAGFNEVRFGAIDAFDAVTVDLWGGFAEKSAKSLFQMYRAGRFQPARVAADLAAIVVDGWRPDHKDSVFFSSFGLNVFDIALAARVLEQAEAGGIGTVVPLF